MQLITFNCTAFPNFLNFNKTLELLKQTSFNNHNQIRIENTSALQDHLLNNIDRSKAIPEASSN